MDSLIPRLPASALDLEIGRLLFDFEARLWAESLEAASTCIEDLAGALQDIADAGKPWASGVARRALKAYGE